MNVGNWFRAQDPFKIVFIGLAVVLAALVGRNMFAISADRDVVKNLRENIGDLRIRLSEANLDSLIEAKISGVVAELRNTNALQDTLLETLQKDVAELKQGRGGSSPPIASSPASARRGGGSSGVSGRVAGGGNIADDEAEGSGQQASASSRASSTRRTGARARRPRIAQAQRDSARAAKELALLNELRAKLGLPQIEASIKNLDGRVSRIDSTLTAASSPSDTASAQHQQQGQQTQPRQAQRPGTRPWENRGRMRMNLL